MNRRYAAYILAIATLCTAGLSALECSYIIDLSPPYIVAGSAFPPADTILADPSVTINFTLDDRGAGVWGDSVLTTVIVNGTDSTDYSATPIIPGDFSPGDTVEVCIRAIDRIFDTLACTCPPNELDTCWRFFIEPPCSSRFDSLWFVEETDCDSMNVVEICYRLESTCEPPWNIGISASSDGGASWGVPMASFIGDFGHLGAVLDTGLHCFQWILSDDFLGFEGCNFRMRIEGDSITPLVSIGCLDSRAPRVYLDCPPDSIATGSIAHLSWHIEDWFFRSDPCSVRIFNSLCGISQTFAITDTQLDWTAPPVECPVCTVVVLARDLYCNWGADTCEFAIVEDSIPSSIDSVWFWEETDCNDSNIVHICYDLSGTGVHNISVQMSSDSGASWTVPLTTLLNSAGDLGDSVLPGRHCFDWLMSEDLPGVEGWNWLVRVGLFTLRDTFMIIDSVSIPSRWYGWGLAYDDGYFWMYDLLDGYAYKKSNVHPDTAAAASLFIGLDYNTDIDFSDGFIYYTTNHDRGVADDTLMRIDVATGIKQTIFASPYPDNYQCAQVIGTSLITSDYDAATYQRMLRADLSSGLPVASLDTVLEEPRDTLRDIEGMAYAHGFLWGVNNFGRLLRIDPVSFDILQSHRVPNSGSGAEGLCWDGRFMWYQNNILQKIYKIDIDEDSSYATFAGGALDSRAPVVSISCPTDTVFYGDSAVFHWTIEDSFWANDECSLFIGFCGEIDTVILTDTVFTWPVPPVSCDSAWVRVAVRDSFCNWGFDSCSFRTFACAAGPVAQVVFPDSCGFITSCADQSVSWLVFDTSGHTINPATFTVRIQVSGRGGVLDTIIHAPNPALIWDGVSRLDFDPSAIPMVFASWDTVMITLVSAYSDIGCPIEKPIECSFLVDLDPPVMLGGFSPTPGTVFSEYPVHFTLYADIIDSICSHYSSLMALEHWREDSLLGSYYYLRATDINFYFAENGDSLRLCVVNIADWPGYDYCPPNTAPDTCWWVYIEFSGGPTARILEPLDLDSSGFAVSACDCQPIILAIHDDEGIDSLSILFEAEGIAYDVATPELSWDGESLLVFTPSAPCWENSDTVHFSLLSAEDIHGTPLVSVVSSRFIADYSGPAISMISSGTITESAFELIFAAFDSVCGISPIDSIVIYRNGLYDTTAFSASTVFLDGLLNGDSLSACIFTEDNCADYCGSNISERCFEIFVEISNFSARVLAPTDIDGDGRIISSCECPRIVWEIHSSIPIVDSLTVIEVGGAEYSGISAAVDYFVDGDSLVWNADGGVCFDDGEIVPFHLLLLVDESGDSFTAAIGDTMIIDLSPPFVEFASPFPSTISLNPVFHILPDDAIGGVDFTGFTLSLDGFDGSAGSPYTSLSGDTIIFDMTLYPDSFAFGDTVLIELTLWDIIDYCEPNRLDTSWSLIIADTVAPTGVLVSPFIGAISACADQRVEWLLSDRETGLDSTRIWVSADGAVFSALDPDLELDITGALVFTPPSDWAEGAHSVCLDSVYDLFGNALPAPICANFTIDLSPPEVVFLEPLCSTVVRDSLAGIIFALADDLSPIYFGRTWLIIGTDSLPISSDTTAITIAMLDTVWRDGDTVSYCVYAADSADFCTGENDTLICCEFYIEISPFNAWVEYPDDGAATSCSLQTVAWLFDGSPARDYIHVTLNDTADFTSHSAEISFAGDSLFFTPISPWANGDTIELCLVDAADTFGTHIGDTVCVTFIVDLEPPLFADWTPTSSVAETSPSISIRLWDEIAGLDTDSLVITVDSARVDLIIVGDTFRFEPSDSGMAWLGGDTVEVCVWAADLALYCGANTDYICWEFIISSGGPDIAILEPPMDSLWSACHGQGAIFTLEDPDGIDTSSIELNVNGVTSTEWIFRNDSLIFAPTAGSFDGDTITVCANASDMLGNPADSAVCVTFFADYSPPVVNSITPTPGSIIGAALTFSVFLNDSGSGIDEASLSLIVNGRRYFPGDGYLSWNGNELYLIPESSFIPGETVTVCLDSILDSPDLCDPNALDSCWSYNVELFPDLWTSADFISLAPASVAEGDSFVFEGMGFLSGTGILSNFFVEIRAGASVLKSSEYINLAPGDTIRESLVISSLEANILSGAPICLSLDAGDNIFESDENNNSACASLDIVSKDCSARPNPFSPNSDLVNDEVKFTYPGISLGGAKIEIYDSRGRLAAKLENISSWDGRDPAGNPLPKGIYIYLVLRGGEVLCKGTIHIAR